MIVISRLFISFMFVSFRILLFILFCISFTFSITFLEDVCDECLLVLGYFFECVDDRSILLV